MKVRPEYLPTPSQISQACAKIRQQWTPAERVRRSVGRTVHFVEPPWVPPLIDTSACTSRVRKLVSDQSA